MEKVVSVPDGPHARKQRDEEITERLDAVYGEEPVGLDPVLARLQQRSVPDEEWPGAPR